MIQESWEHLTDDECIENHYVDCLERERAWIEKRLMAIYRQEAGNLPEMHSDMGREWNALNTRLDFINKQLAPLFSDELWTTDEVAAILVEEDLEKARNRESFAKEQYCQARDYCRVNPGSPYGEKESNRWLKILSARQEEVFRLENLLIDNPASGWLPF